ncbi:MAG: O-antigen ligase C-terminal domain-containing protein, partial [Rubrivivax sp.]|nr:O-antigen ligase C-terminal domain-containing protein [Rubrivivax sp.]
ALLVALYALAFVGALALGAGLASEPGEERRLAVDALALGLLAGASLSVFIALAQWAGGPSLPFFTADLPRGGRPFGNLAQPNHLCSAAFLGLCGAAVLHESGRLGRLAFWACALYLVLGMTITGSRAGWLQLLLFVLALAALGARTGARLRTRDGLALLVAYALAVWAWPQLNQFLLNFGGRDPGAQMEGGVRVPYWLAMLDAIGRAPWAGYGWQQVAAAQWAVALDHPPLGHLFEHAHNVVLDLLLWTGVPVGGALVLAAAWALLAPLRHLRDPRALGLSVAALGLVAHGLVEYPLEYAYFLLPMGVALGAAHALSPGQRDLRLSAPVLRGGAVLLTAVLGVVAVDYLEAEQNHRLLRLESARIGTVKIESVAPELRVLDQLQAFLAFARTEARPGMGADQLAQMSRAARRWPIPPVMLRHALAAGLNGQPEEARQTLARLCRMHSRERCRELGPAWAALQHRYPAQLSGIAPPPEANAR